MSELRALASLAAIGLCGLSLLALLPRGCRPRDRLLDLTLAFPLGLIAVTLAYAAFDALGLPLRGWAMTAAWLGLAAAVAVMRRLGRSARHTTAIASERSQVADAAPVERPPRSPRFLAGIFLAILLANDAGVLALTLSRPVNGTDPMSIWTARAVLIHERGDLDSRELKRATFYPPLLPCGLAWIMDAIGRRDFLLIKLLEPALMLALQLFLVQSLRRRVPVWMALATALVACSSASFAACTREPYADLPFVGFVLVATVALLDLEQGDARALALVWIATLGAVLARTEGIPTAPGLLLLAAWRWPDRRRLAPVLAGGVALVALGTVIAVWRFKGYEPFGSPEGFTSDTRAAGQRIRENSTYILGYLGSRLLRFDRFGYSVLLPVAFLIGRARALARSRAARLALVVALGIVLVHYASYIVYPGNVRQHLPLSNDRVPWRFTLPLALAALLTFAREGDTAGARAPGG